MFHARRMHHTRNDARARDADRRALDAFFEAERASSPARETLAQAYERGYNDGYAHGKTDGMLRGWLWFGSWK